MTINVFETVKRVAVIGEPKLDVETMFPNAEHDFFDGLAELSPDGDLYDVDAAAHAVLAYVRKNGAIYVCQPLNGSERTVLKPVIELRPDSVIDEAVEMLSAQVEGEPITDVDAFEEAVLEATANADQLESSVEVMRGEEDNEVLFYAQYRETSPQKLVFVEDGTIELNGAILRPVALIATGFVHNELLGGRVLTPTEVVRFIANRVAVNGPDELCGYGRAFGPSKDDHTNACLVPRAREFRAKGLCGVVGVSLTDVAKAKPELVIRTANGLRKRMLEAAREAVKRLIRLGCVEADLVAVLDDSAQAYVPGLHDDIRLVLATYVQMHQQAKELYVGEAAVRAFRHRVFLDAKGTLTVEAYGKSSKHWRVDPGTYCLYTDNDGYVDVDTLIGQFEESNDGSVYAPVAQLSGIRGWLKETVKAVKNFRHMSAEAIDKYFDATMLVEEGDTIYPGDPVFRVGDVEHVWSSKADYGVVRKIVEIMDPYKRKLAHFEVRVDAYFESELKLRGFGKGLVCPAEAAGVSIRAFANGVEDKTPLMLVGAPGIVKDSAAAMEYILSCEPVVGVVKTKHCRTSFEAMLKKHMPDETLPEYEEDDDPVVKIKRYGNVTLAFDERTCEITTIDPDSVKAKIRVQIEASPVAQSVGSSGMTMPQIGFLSSFESGNTWLCDQVLPGVQKRARLLGYFHAVAGQVDMNDGLTEPDEADDISLEDFDSEAAQEGDIDLTKLFA